MRLTLALCLWLILGSAAAENYLSHQFEDNTLVIATDDGDIELFFVAEDAVYVHYMPTGVKQLPGELLNESATPLSSKVALRENELVLLGPNEQSRVTVEKNPLTLRFSHRGKQALSEELGVFVNDTMRGFRFVLSKDEKLAGGGQRVLGMDRRGHRLPLYNRTHYGYQDQSSQMYYGLPGTLSSAGYLLMFDNGAKAHLDLGASEPDVLQFDAVGGRTAYLVAMGEDVPDILNNYTQASGRQPLPPRWVFGHLASRFGYRNEAQAREVISRFSQAEMPLDAIIFDLFWFGPDIQGHMGTLDWDREAFPQPEDMIADFARQGIKTLLISEPFILKDTKPWLSGAEAGAYASQLNGHPATFDMFFGRASLVDVFNRNGTDWFWQHYKRQVEWGAAAFWGDLGEPEVHPQVLVHRLDDGTAAMADEVHNSYGHRWARTLFHGLQQDYPERRPFMLMRSGFAGSQRYGMAPWTGDVSRTWKALKAQIELSLQMGMLGLSYNHSDLGGFISTDTFDPELYVRWLQFGAFQPIFRPHAHESVAPEAVFHGPDVIAKVKQALSWRYELLAYNYDLAVVNHRSGMPLMRPVLFDDPERFNEDIAFFWGPSLLVLPVVEPGVKQIEHELPAGEWFDYWNDKPYSQGKHQFPVSSERIPVLVKAGSIIPNVPVVHTTKNYLQDQVTFHYWHHDSVDGAEYVWYRDDGESNAYMHGAYSETALHIESVAKGLAVNVSQQGSFDGLPATTKISLVLHNWPKDSEVSLNGEVIEHLYRSDTQLLTVHFDFENQPLTLRVQ